jgi:hypothetical protein
MGSESTPFGDDVKRSSSPSCRGRPFRVAAYHGRAPGSPEGRVRHGSRVWHAVTKPSGLPLLMDRKSLNDGCRDRGCTQSYWQIRRRSPRSTARHREKLRIDATRTQIGCAFALGGPSSCTPGQDVLRGQRPAGICEGGERPTGKKSLRQGCLGLLCAVCGDMVRRGAHGIKNPLPVTRFRRGLQYRRRLDRGPRGALTSEAAYPLQSSSWQGLLLHEYSCPTSWIFAPFAPTDFNIVPPLPYLSRG